MPSDLPLDQSQATAELMLRIHADFRERFGLPALPTAWTLRRELAALGERAVRIDRPMLASRIPLIGRMVEAVRRRIWEVVKPVAERQADVNGDLVLMLEALARDREQGRHAHRILTLRISELEEKIERLQSREPRRR